MLLSLCSRPLPWLSASSAIWFWIGFITERRFGNLLCSRSLRLESQVTGLPDSGSVLRPFSFG